MKIAYVIINANRREGTSRAVLEVAERLADQHDVHLWARRAEDFDAEKLTLHRLGGPDWPSVLDLSSFVYAADRRLRAEKYDVIHCAGVNTTCADVYTVQTIQVEKRRMMGHVDAHRGAGLHRQFTRSLYDRRVILGERACYTRNGPRGVRAFAPVAEGTKTELLRHYPVEDAEIATIPNAADLQRFTPQRRATARPEILRRHGLSDNDFLLIFSGGEWRRKGLDLAIRAVAAIDDRRVKLIVAGTDPVSDEIEQLPAKLGIDDRVVFAGFRSDIENYYAAGDLFLFPTAYEAFSLATIEAAASGLPVLMPQVSGAAELIGSGDAGVVIERNPASIAHVVAELAHDDTRRMAMQRAARATVERSYNWDTVAAQTSALYERLLERRQQEVTRN